MMINLYGLIHLNILMTTQRDDDNMKYEKLKEMPRFDLIYRIKFFNDKDKDQIVKLVNSNLIQKKDVELLCGYEDKGTYSITLDFENPLFCGFSLSDAIKYMFSPKIVNRLEKIISKYSSNIKEITLHLACYENIFAKTYSMNTDIVGKAAEIVHKLKPEMYLIVGKDGFTFFQLRRTCNKVCGINIDVYSDYNVLMVDLKQELKKFMKNKKENYKEIILLRYSIIYLKKVIARQRKNNS